MVVVPPCLNVVLEGDAVMMTAIARENSVVALATVKISIPQLQNLVIVVQVIVILTHPVNRGRICFIYVVLNLAAVYPLYVPIFMEG